MPTNTIAAINSVVATGRRMNGADGLMWYDQLAPLSRGRRILHGAPHASPDRRRNPTVLGWGKWSGESHGWRAFADRDDGGQPFGGQPLLWRGLAAVLVLCL